MARKGENIYRRKDGRWEGRYIADRAKDGRARIPLGIRKILLPSQTEIAGSKRNGTKRTQNPESA